MGRLRCRSGAAGGTQATSGDKTMSFYTTDDRVRSIGEELVRFALAEFGARGLAADRLALTLLLHERPLTGDAPLPRGFGYRAAEPFYPCSVVKVFYLVAAQARLAEML